MTLKSYLFIMSAMTLLSWGAWAFTLFTINPEITNWIGFALFYSSLFLSLVGTAAILGFVVRFLFLKQEMAFRSVKEAFRQAFLMAIMVVASLLLLSKDMLSWLNLALLIVGLTVLEFFLLSLEPKRPAVKKDESDVSVNENSLIS